MSVGSTDELGEARAHADEGGGTPLLKRVKATLAGVTAALLFGAVLSYASDEMGLNVLAAMLGLSGLLYVRPFVRDERLSRRLPEAAVFAFTVAAAVLGRRHWPALMAAGYCVHGVWDICHHRALNLGARVTVAWLPKACASFDLLIAAFILFRYAGAPT